MPIARLCKDRKCLPTTNIQWGIVSLNSSPKFGYISLKINIDIQFCFLYFTVVFLMDVLYQSISLKNTHDKIFKIFLIYTLQKSCQPLYLLIFKGLSNSISQKFRNQVGYSLEYIAPLRHCGYLSVCLAISCITQSM